MNTINSTASARTSGNPQLIIGSLFTSIRRHYRAQADRRHLMSLSNHHLDDMGIRREDLMQKTSLTIFWDRT